MKIKITEIETTKEKLLLYHKPEFIILEEKQLNNEINKIIHKDDKPVNFYEAPDLPSTIEELRQKELIPEPKIEYIVVEKEQPKEEKEDLSDIFTLEEYKQMRELLQEIKDKQNKED